MNGLLLFMGGVGSGESEIWCYILEVDLLEVIVLLLMDMFYNIGIVIYVWVLINKKKDECKGKV